ncbi:hydrophobic surface binding protein [Pluteus cervinus]|uniref:Hydrophobic surface binding protein n=1 Tax=Pluteus cervinus TaxID=181527 RepID=A0ACD3AC92_9AGAR|nr:hydrophobic surface binding protein [Pluteus cervinus]
MRFASSIALALSLVSAFAIPTKRTVADIEAALQTLTTQVTGLDSAINSFPATGGSLLSALAIHSTAGSVVTTLTSATTAIQATSPVGEADGQTIFGATTALGPVISDALTQIVTKKAAFARSLLGLPVAGIPALVLQDLKSLSAGVAAYSSALAVILPADLVGGSNDLAAQISAAFATAISAYSS